MNRYYQSYEIKDIKEYCQNRCIKIVNEHLDNKEHLPYFRGSYKGYLYMIKVCNKLLQKNMNLKRYELYNHLKTQLRKAKYNCNVPGEFSSGLVNSLYDLMNYVSDVDKNTNI